MRPSVGHLIVVSTVSACVLGPAACFPPLESDDDADTLAQSDTVTDTGGQQWDGDAAGDSGNEPVDTAERPRPEPPAGVTATTDRAVDVDVSWLASAGATGYLVERCGGTDCGAEAAWGTLTSEPISGTHYTDTAVAVPPPPGAPSGVRASTDDAAEVVLTWEPVTAPAAPQYSYRVISIGPSEAGPPSHAVAGHCAERPVLGYQVRVDGGAWLDAGASPDWRDADADPPSVSAGVATASNGIYAEFVRLGLTGAAAAAGRERGYEVRAVTAYGPAPSSAVVMGSRAAGALVIRWERSADTSAEDFEALSGADGATFDDTGAPADGSVRWYRASVSADGATSATTAAVAGSRQPPPGVPAGLTASNDREAHVLVTWQPVAGATGYEVYRDGVRLTTAGAISVTTYQDTGAPAPGATWAAPMAVVASTDDPEGVHLSWTSPSRPLGVQVTYRVRAVGAAGEGPLSAAAIGRRAAPALAGFEVEATVQGGGSSWLATGSATPGWTHVDAPLATYTPGSVVATQGAHRAHVRVVLSGYTENEARSVSYRVRGLLADGTRTPISAGTTGRRALGEAVWQWQRSAGVAPTGFADLAGAQDSELLDTAAPADGSARWYQFVWSAPGAEPAIVGPVEGWRLAFVRVGGGGGHTCAVARDGRLWCWGSNEFGALGRGTSGAVTLGPGPVQSLAGIVDVDASSSRSCALGGVGDVWCWGASPVGDGTSFERSMPVKVASDAVSVAVGGGAHTCVALTNGQVRCWGAGGVVGDGTEENRLAPVAVWTGLGVLLTGTTQVGTHGQHTCARTSAGIVWCWGLDLEGVIGVAGWHEGFSTVAMTADLISSSRAVVTSGDALSCSLSVGGSVQCWGSASGGRRGDGGVAAGGHEPSTVVGVADAVEISTSEGSTCVRLALDGSVRCWGRNTSGQLGDGSPVEFSNVPVVAGSSLASTAALGSGNAHHCAIMDGDVWCWGNNSTGQLGPGVTESFSGVPVKVGFP